ncbi:unnamed protein product [Rotaria sordida]|uniref:Uncharacterized protein n=1 Tax=Rotaria sordida TaxID=392033 RepID=A0A813VSP5_9BILA|nr:unnamed protein product [Rotaria sordida]CAF3565544.1 unnamed protein product [Rotaria sordida]
MSRTINGRIRTNSKREVYVEQMPHNRHRKIKSFKRLHSYDDSEVAYRSTPDYLKQLMNTSTLSNGHSARSVTRTYSASEITSPNNFNRPTSGNPKYKTQEEYYDEIQFLKKELKDTKTDNDILRARVRRLEEDNARKRKEMDNFYDTNKDGDIRRTLTGSSNSTANVVMNLKQRLFKLDLQLKQKETIIDEMKSDPRWTKGTELEIQNRALFNELEKQKLEKLNFIQHDYIASIDEEKMNAVRKLETEKRELKIENDNLKKKLNEMEKLERDGQLSSRQRDVSTDRDLRRKIEDLKDTCRNYRNDLDQMKDELKQMRHERDKYRDKLDIVKEDLEEMKHERDQYRKKFERINNDFDELRSERFRQMKSSNQTDRLSIIASRQGSYSSEEPTRKDSRSSTPLQKSKEHIGSHSSLTRFDRNTPSPSITRKTTSRNFRRDNWNSDDENRLKNFREKHAATVIQRGWREHHKSHKHSFTSKTKQYPFDKRNSKIGGIKSPETQSPRTSQQKLGSKIDNLDSSNIKNRFTSANISNESALKIVQASLRGYLNRDKIDKTSRIEKLHRIESDDDDDDDDIIGKPSKQFGSQYASDKKRENFFKHSKQNFADSNGLHNDKIRSDSRSPTSNRDSTSNFHRSLSPPVGTYRPSSPHISSGSGSKQFFPNDRNKLEFDNRNNREPFMKFRPSSPSNDHRLSRYISPEDTQSSSRQSNVSLRKSPIHSKQSLKNTYNNNDDHDHDNLSDF